MPHGQAIQFLPLKSPFGHELIHQGNEAAVVGAFKQVHHFVDDDVFEALGWFLSQLQVDEDGLGFRCAAGLWSHYWNRGGDLRISLINLLNDMKRVAGEKHLLAEHNTVYEFIQSNGESCPEISVNNVNQFETRWIHGDLNSGNVLVCAAPSNNIILIDFASADKGHVVKDFAKLERDFYFRILDGEWTSGSSDWERMKIWMKLASIAASKTAPANGDLAGNERALLEFIRELRSGLVKVNSKITIREYLVGLVYYSLTAILIPEMSLQKKMFGIWYVSELLKRAERSLQADLMKDWANPA